MTLRTQRFGAVCDQLKAIDPKNLLRKGYSIVFSQKDNSVINGSHQLTSDDAVRFVFADGAADARVTAVHPQEELTSEHSLV